MSENPHTATPTPAKSLRTRRTLPRIAFSVSEAARMLGQKPDALRRTIERHAVAEDDELVARLNHGITARRRKDLGRWSVHVPPALFADSGR